MDSSDTDSTDQTYDLAILSDDGLRKIADKCGRPWESNELRPAVISSLREGGFDRYSVEKDSELAQLKEAVTLLSEQVTIISAKLASLSSPPLHDAVVSIQKTVQRLEEKDATVSPAGETPTCVPRVEPAELAAAHGTGTSHAKNKPASGIPTAWTAEPRGPQHRTPPPSVDSPFKWNYVSHKRRKVNEKHEGAGTLKGATSKGKRVEIFVGNLDLETTASTIVHHCTANGITPTTCKVFPSKKRFGTAVAWMTVWDDEATLTAITDEEFWPEEIYARRWIRDEDSGKK